MTTKDPIGLSLDDVRPKADELDDRILTATEHMYQAAEPPEGLDEVELSEEDAETWRRQFEAER